MTPEAAFIFGAVTTFVITAIVLTSIVFRPRFDQLIQSRADWRERAELAEHALRRAEGFDMKLLGEWGSAFDQADTDA